ncbi:50S ribosomal protein L10 [Niveispirillum sp.]|uniref:50S ribosomal protein L10 n=1 Tax=Niveispirillum sp. TaxID=1917217 RepID=UPI0025E1FDBA|nr:50S ribosomal protein L10 [Niveispirillum sp.]
MRSEDVELVMTKKTLLRQALPGLNIDASVVDGLEGEVALAFGFADEVTPAKLLAKFGKTKDALKMKGAVVNGQFLNASEAIALAKGEYLLLVDADLIGLSPADITALIAPVLSGRAGLSISLRRNAPWVWRRIGLDYISGERVLPKALIEPRLAGLANLPKFGFEVFLNELCIAAARPVAVVLWPGVISPMKAAKYGRWRGLQADIRMIGDIFRSVPATRLLRQIIVMRRLRLR